jgi:hypothetical protein
MLAGALVVSHPGGAILFHKSYACSFGLTSTTSKRKWEPWNLAALLSAVQLYASNLSADWPDDFVHNVANDVSLPKSDSTPASLSYFTFQGATLYFWDRRTQSKSGTLTAIVVRDGSPSPSPLPSKHHANLAHSISDAFHRHCQGNIPSQTVRGFSSPFRAVLGGQLDYLVQSCSSVLSMQTDTSPSWCCLTVQLPTPPRSASSSQQKVNSTRPPRHNNKNENTATSDSSVVLPVPPKKPTKVPHRRFRGFFRRRRKENVTAEAIPPSAAPSSTFASASTPSPASATDHADQASYSASASATANQTNLAAPVSTSPLLNTASVVKYCFAAQCHTTDTSVPILMRISNNQEASFEGRLHEQRVLNHPDVRVQGTVVCADIIGLGNFRVEIMVIAEDVPVVRIQSAMVTMTLPWGNRETLLNKDTIPSEEAVQLFQHIQQFAVFLASRTKHRSF